MLGIFHITAEGESPKPGFNFYHIRDKINFGFRFKYGNKLRFFRYSKRMKKWHFQKIVAKVN